MVIININCIYYKNVNRCAHPDRPKFLWFRRSCIEPYRLCSIKEQHPRPIGPFPQAPLTEWKKRGGMSCKITNNYYERPKLPPPQTPQKIKRKAGFI